MNLMKKKGRDYIAWCIDSKMAWIGSLGMLDGLGGPNDESDEKYGTGSQRLL